LKLLFLLTGRAFTGAAVFALWLSQALSRKDSGAATAGADKKFTQMTQISADAFLKTNLRSSA